MRRLLLLAPLLLLACGDSSREPVPSAVARFDLSLDAAMDFSDAPFPSDLHRDASGAPRIGGLPTTHSDEPLFDAMRALVATRSGFCATCNVSFPIDGELDRAALPPRDSPDEPSADDAVLLADVDPASPERGRLFPLRTEWDPSTGIFALRPVRGIALHRTRRYAAVLTSQLRASDGSPLGASEQFRELRDGGGDARALEVIDPALDELARIGVPRRRIVALAVFTTEDVTADVLSVRDAVQDGDSLDVTLERTRREDEIDELLGFPSEDRPGIDVPPVPGSGGTRSIVHASIAEVITGSFLAPRVVEGAGTDIGVARRDGSGGIEAGPREPVPFVLTIPAVADKSNLPIAIAHHGFNASRTTGFATAETAARAGVAVLAIDGFQHGERAVSARDEGNSMRGGLPVADGFAETTPADVSARVFGLVGAAPGLALFPGYSLGTFLQFAADVSSAVRLVREGGLSRAVSDSSDAPIRFDAERIGYIGNSLGAVVGVSALVAEPDIRAAVQNVQPGSIIETLAESPEFRPLVEALFLPPLGVGIYDEVERHLIFNPIVDLSRWILEPIDPLALAPYLFRDPVGREAPAEVLFQVAALDEVASPLATSSMIAASEAPRVTVYDPAAHGMLEVLDQISRLEPPAVPPFRMREAAIPVTNPIVVEHLEIEEFLRGSLAAP